MMFHSKKIKDITSSPPFWVALSLLFVLIPHFARLPIWMTVFIVFFLLWRLAGIVNSRLLPNKWLLVAITLSTSAATIFHFGTILGKTAGTAFLSILLAIKLLESHNKRDYMLLLGISFFIIVTNFLFSQSIPTVIYMLITVVILVMSMISIDLDTLEIDLKHKFRFSLRLVLQALPLMLIMFVLFPRIPGPLWQLPDDSETTRTGLSDSMSPGNITQLIQSNEVAFRVKFDNQPPAQNKLYWRAMVLWQFDGRTWKQGETNLNPNPVLEGISELIEYTVTLEPHDKQYLFAMDMPAQSPENSIYNADFLLRSDKKISSIHQYKMSSYLNYRIENTLSKWERDAGLKLPNINNTESIAMAKKWKQDLQDPVSIVNHALNYFNKNNFSYSLQPPATPGFNPVDSFLFETQKGFCEHYASSFTLLMRAAGIPARVILGYQGGNINPINQYLTVRQSNAHAWSEIWLKNRGWVRVDPTSAIAPERIEQNLDSALNTDEYRPLYMHLANSPLKKLINYWDAIDNGWNQWVIGYDAKSQYKLLSSIFNKKVNFYDIVKILIVSLLAMTLIISIYIFKSTSRTIIDPVEKIYQDFCKKLSRKGLKRNIYEGPADFTSRAMEAFPDQKDKISLITRIYISLRYKSMQSDRYLTRMKKMVKSLKLK